MTRSMKAMLAVAVLALAATAASAQPPVKVLPKQLPPVLPKGSLTPQPFPLPHPAPQWKLGVRISANPGGGLSIHEVFSSSPAELAGLRAGMVLLAVDGVVYNDPAAARAKVMFKSGDTLDLIYGDGTGFYQVTAQLSTVMMMLKGPAGAAGQKAVPQLKNLKRVPVLDPRKK